MPRISLRSLQYIKKNIITTWEINEWQCLKPGEYLASKQMKEHTRLHGYPLLARLPTSLGIEKINSCNDICRQPPNSSELAPSKMLVRRTTADLRNDVRGERGIHGAGYQRADTRSCKEGALNGSSRWRAAFAGTNTLGSVIHRSAKEVRKVRRRWSSICIGRFAFITSGGICMNLLYSFNTVRRNRLTYL